MPIRPEQKVVSIRLPGMGGWNAFLDPSGIEDNQLADIQNMTYDKGFLSVREGSTLVFSKPTSETLTELQLITAQTSDGLEYTIAVYGNHFWLRDETNNRWIRINNLWVPVETTIFYGHTNWQNGRGDDRLYGCNGVDSAWRWDIVLDQLNGAAGATDTTVTLDDATRFPTPSGTTISAVNTGTDTITATAHGLRTGDLVFYDTDGTVITGLTDGGTYFAIRTDANDFQLATTYANAIAGTAIDLTGSGTGTQKIFLGNYILVINDGTNEIQVPYISKSGNVLTLTGQIGTAMADNASVTLSLFPRPNTNNGIQLGKHISKHQRRLIIANYFGGETVVWGSVQGDPEDFSIASTISGGFTQTIADGNGEITGLDDFGRFLVIEKEDSMYALRFQIDSTLGSKLTIVEPLLSGDSLGPLNVSAVAKAFNTLYYPTRSNGFISVVPTASGDTVSVTPTLLSQDVDPFLETVIFDYTRKGVTQNKIYWSVALKGATQNTIVLEYDILRKRWSKHTGWGVKDFAGKQGEVRYLGIGDGAVYQINSGAYNDNNNPYLSSGSFKRFDYEEVGRPKNQDVIFVQGYMTTASEFFVDVFFNEDGVLGKQTYRLNKDTSGISFSSPVTDENGDFILGEPVLGMASLKGIGDVRVFRCYLGIKKSYSFFNIQPRIYGSRSAFWGITALSSNPEIVNIIPPSLLVIPEVDE